MQLSVMRTRRLGRRYYSRPSMMRRYEARDGWSALLGCATTLRSGSVDKKSPASVVSILNPAHGAALLASGILPTLHTQDGEYPHTSKWIRRLFERSSCNPPLRASSNRQNAEHALDPALTARLCHAMILRVTGGSEDTEFLNDWAKSAGFNDLRLVRESFECGILALRESLEDAVEPPLALAAVLAHLWRKATNKGDLWLFVKTVERLRPEFGFNETALPFSKTKVTTSQLRQFWCSLHFDEEMHEDVLAVALIEACLYHPPLQSITFETAVAAIARLRSQGTSTGLAIVRSGTSGAMARPFYIDNTHQQQHDAIHHSLISDHSRTYGQTLPRPSLLQSFHSDRQHAGREDHRSTSPHHEYSMNIQANDASRIPPWTLAGDIWHRRYAEKLADAWSDAHARRKYQPWLLAALSSPIVIEACVEKQRPVPRALLAAALPSGPAGSMSRAALIEASFSAASGSSSSSGRSSMHQYLKQRQNSWRSKDDIVENTASSSEDYRYAPPSTETSSSMLEDESSQTAARVRKLESAVSLAQRIVDLEFAYRTPDNAWRYRLCFAVFQNSAHDVQGAEALLIDRLRFPTLGASAARLAASFDSARWLHALANDHGVDIDALGENEQLFPVYPKKEQPLSSSSIEDADQYSTTHSKHSQAYSSTTSVPLLRPLAVAAANNATHALRYLLHRAVRPDHPARDLAATPLGLAARAGHTEICALLLEAGADPSVADTQGNTPMHMARSVEVAQLMLDAGAQTRIRNNAGHTPYDILPAHITRYLRRDSFLPNRLEQRSASSFHLSEESTLKDEKGDSASSPHMSVSAGKKEKKVVDYLDHHVHLAGAAGGDGLSGSSGSNNGKTTSASSGAIPAVKTTTSGSKTTAASRRSDHLKDGGTSE